MFKRFISSLVCFSFILSNLQYAQSQDFSVNQLPVPGTMIGESIPFAPISLKGLIVNPQKPLEFQFIVDTGNSFSKDMSSPNAAVGDLKQQLNQLVKYFLAGLTIPEGDLWVNLSPYEKSRMVPEVLGQTDLGRDLLAQDYILKQLTASLIYPEKDLGRAFWSRVYAKAQKQFGTTNVPVDTFNKVWILPDQAQVYENGDAAYVTKSTLKVMLDEDYMALSRHSEGVRSTTEASKDVLRSFANAQDDRAHSIASNIIRQIILPEIQKEVNTGKNFAPLRQIYQAMILAKWYKETIQNGLLDAIYTNKNKVAGVDVDDPTLKEQIYNRYLQAYKKGAFNYIKEDPTPEGQLVPRKYFSGGTCLAMKVDHKGRASMIRKAHGALLSIIVLLSAFMPMGLSIKAQQVPVASVQSNAPPQAGAQPVNSEDLISSEKTISYDPLTQETTSLLTDYRKGGFQLKFKKNPRYEGYTETWSKDSNGADVHTVYTYDNDELNTTTVTTVNGVKIRDTDAAYDPKTHTTTSNERDWINGKSEPVKSVRVLSPYGMLIDRETYSDDGTKHLYVPKYGKNGAEVGGTGYKFDEQTKKWEHEFDYSDYEWKNGILSRKKIDVNTHATAIEHIDIATDRPIEVKNNATPAMAVLPWISDHKMSIFMGVGAAALGALIFWYEIKAQTLKTRIYFWKKTAGNVDKIVALLNYNRDDVREVAKNALIEMGGSHNNDVIKSIRQFLSRTDLNWRVRSNAYEVLRQLGDAEAIRVFSDYELRGREHVIRELRARQPKLAEGDLMGFENAAALYWMEGDDFTVIFSIEESHLDTVPMTNIGYEGLETQVKQVDRPEVLYIVRGKPLSDKPTPRQESNFDVTIKQRWDELKSAGLMKKDPEKYQRFKAGVWAKVFYPDDPLKSRKEPVGQAKDVRQPKTAGFRFDSLPPEVEAANTMFEEEFASESVRLRFNNGPQFPYHFLVMPEYVQGLTQLIRGQDILALLEMSARSNPEEHLVFIHNSFGAGAVANQLHIHGIYYPGALAIEEAQQASIIQKQGLTISLLQNYPVDGFVFEGDKRLVAKAAGDLIKKFQEDNRPYNVIVIGQKVFIIPRGSESAKIGNNYYNIGGLELAGNLELPTEQLAREATVEDIQGWLSQTGVEYGSFEYLIRLVQNLNQAMTQTRKEPRNAAKTFDRERKGVEVHQGSINLNVGSSSGKAWLIQDGVNLVKIEIKKISPIDGPYRLLVDGVDLDVNLRDIDAVAYKNGMVIYTQKGNSRKPVGLYHVDYRMHATIPEEIGNFSLIPTTRQSGQQQSYFTTDDKWHSIGWFPKAAKRSKLEWKELVVDFPVVMTEPEAEQDEKAAYYDLMTRVRDVVNLITNKGELPEDVIEQIEELGGQAKDLGRFDDESTISDIQERLQELERIAEKIVELGGEDAMLLDEDILEYHQWCSGHFGLRVIDVGSKRGTYLVYAFAQGEGEVAESKMGTIDEAVMGRWIKSLDEKIKHGSVNVFTLALFRKFISEIRSSNDAMLTAPRGESVIPNRKLGGIDLNQINVNRNGKTVKVNFDQAQLNQLMQGGFQGFSFRIESVSRIASPFPLLGINSVKQETLAKA